MSLTHQTVYLKDYQSLPFEVESVDLHVALQDAITTVTSELHIKKRDVNSSLPLTLQGENLDLVTVALDGVALEAGDYELTATSLTLSKDLPSEFRLQTVVKIRPEENKTMMGLYRSRGNYCTQCEAEGFRKITFFFDRPDVMTRFTTTIEADKQTHPYLLSNGNLVAQGELDNGRHWVKWHDPSLKPCYLFALVAGDFDVLYDHFETQSGREVKLEFFLEKGFGDQGDFAMASLKRAMKWDEDKFGLEYDLDIYMVVAVSDFNMGAMENKGLNVFNTKYVLANAQTATDADYVGIERVIGHEYFHNWTGNRVTCRDWFQLTLKEGLTVFRDQCFTEDMTSAAMARISEVSVVKNAQFAEDAGPLSHPIRPPSYMEINNFYTTTVYRKGAEVIRMIHTLIGEQAFRKGMDIYFQRHDGQAVTTEDFIAAMEAASGRDFTQFKRWYNQPGTPTLTLSTSYDASLKTFTLTVTQSCPRISGYDEPAPLHMPLVLGFIGRDGNSIAVQSGDAVLLDSGSVMVEITAPEHRVVFTGVECEPVLSINRGFSAPVMVEFDMPLEDLALLMVHDTDPVARWSAAQLLSERVIIDTAECLHRGEAVSVNPLLVETWRQVITSTTEDGSLLAQLCSLPMVNYLLRQKHAADVASLFSAKKQVMAFLSQQLQSAWLEGYERSTSTAAYAYNKTAMAQRAWKNRCLYFLVRSDVSTFAQKAYQQLEKSDNMTDSMGAIVALTHVDSPFREKALDLFYQRWHQEPLVYNKWLAAQAQSIRPDTLLKVKELLNHQQFDSKNPNNIYALLCEFANNPVALHLNDEEAGYQLVADQVIAIDRYNPQVASRVLIPLTRWQQLDHQRAARVQEALRRIANQPGLSADVAEVVQKSLAVE